MRSALSFLTVLGRAGTPGPTTLDWFPVVGAGLGLLLGVWWWLADKAWPGIVAAGVVVVADLALTGLLHLDGVVDTADGLIPPLPLDRRLAAMADPHAGAFGVGAAAVLILLRWAGLAALRPGILLLGGIWCMSRTMAAAAARTRPYARAGGGMVGLFGGPYRWWVTSAGIAGAAFLAAGWRWAPGLAAVGATALTGAAVLWWAERRIGGITGDVLGAAIFVGETAGLVTAAAKW